MQPLKMFVEEHAERLHDKYQYDFSSTIESTGLDNFRDFGGLRDECHTLVCDLFGVEKDKCWDEAGIFDLAADYWGTLEEEVECRLFATAYPALASYYNRPTRRAEEVLYECAQLMAKKDKDYNDFPQAEYYRDLDDIWYMCYTKVKRLQSLIAKEQRGERANYEGVQDTARDLINYASFLIEFSEGKMRGQGEID